MDEKDLKELKEIYFESSARKDFKDVAEKDAFYWKYLGYYLQHFPEFVWIAKGERILGYVVAAPASDDPALYKIQPHLEIFKKYFKDYPGHLHINLHNDARGQGLGSKLLLELEKQLQSLDITGLHIMTGVDSRNKNFYTRLGFDFQMALEFSGHPILLMGKSLKRDVG
jgi:GNAT superfamily N-acetyltransferase